MGNGFTITRSLNGENLGAKEIEALQIINPTLAAIFASVVKRVADNGEQHVFSTSKNKHTSEVEKRAEM